MRSSESKRRQSGDNMSPTKSPEDDISTKISAEMLPQCSVALERLQYTEGSLKDRSPVPFEKDGFQLEDVIQKEIDTIMPEMFYEPATGEGIFMDSNTWEQSKVAEDDIKMSSEQHIHTMGVLMMAKAQIEPSLKF